MLTYFDLLALCVNNAIMDKGIAEAIYNDVNAILDHKSGHSFTVKQGKTMERITNKGWDKILF
jgi:hypothetical protein